MGDYRNKSWATHTNYTEEQIGSILSAIGMDVESETGKDFICYCPYHSNTDTPSFSVSKYSGVFLCFNAMCGAKGILTQLVRDKLDEPMTEFELIRFVNKHKAGRISYAERAKKRIAQQEFTLLPDEMFQRLHDGLWNYPEAVRYMVEDRSFDEETLEHFMIGYSSKNDMITVPMQESTGKYVGLIGRSLVGKSFKNSVGLPVSRTLWNLHRAKAASDTVIICEASFDAMRIHQAGYPNVVALLGGNLSSIHIEQFQRHFNSVVIMTDFDDKTKYVKKYCRVCPVAYDCQGHNPGRDLGMHIATSLPGLRIKWAVTDYKLVYPNGAKDPGDMTDEEIVVCIKNAVNTLEYKSWSLT